MTVAALCAVAVLSLADGWTETAAWLQRTGQRDLALEAAVLQAHAGDGGRVAQGALLEAIIAVLDDPMTDAQTRTRAIAELKRARPDFSGMLAVEAGLALITAERQDALSAEQRDVLLAGVLRDAAAVRRSVQVQLDESTRHAQRRRLQALLRRAALLEGTVRVDLGGHDSGTRSLLLTALTGDARADDTLVAAMPEGMYETPDAAWACAALARLALSHGDVPAATRWLGHLIAVQSPVLDAPIDNVLVAVLSAMGQETATVFVEDHMPMFSTEAMIEVVRWVPMLDGTMAGRLSDDQVRAALANSPRALPDWDTPGVALAAHDRAVAGARPWHMAHHRLEQLWAKGDRSAVIGHALAMSHAQQVDLTSAWAVLGQVPEAKRTRMTDEMVVSVYSRMTPEQRAAASGARLMLQAAMASPDLQVRKHAALAIAAMDDTPPQDVIALVHGDDSPAARAVRDAALWRGWRAGEVAAAQAVQAAADMLPDPGAARRVLEALPHAELPVGLADVLATRAIASLESGQLVAQIRWALQIDDTARALAVFNTREDHVSPEDVRIAAGVLLEHPVPLGDHVSDAAAVLLGMAPAAVQESAQLTTVHRTVLQHWARHVLGGAHVPLDTLRTLAAIDVLDQDGCMALATVAQSKGDWHLAHDRWRRAVRFGGPRVAWLQLQELKALVHVDVDAARVIAAQLAVLLEGTAEGDEIAALRDQLEPAP
ncbi:MAG: hypothetical protein MK074_04290 [Phycisphaerales bacterium]|nr:hypothetical protein [Phycisphaerales bacterium]